MTEEQFLNYVDMFVTKFKEQTPIDTGNLRNESIRMVQKSPTKIVVYVDRKIAPYMPYTDKPWLAKRWNGKKNPNEGWFKKAVERAIRKTNRIMKARLKRK